MRGEWSEEHIRILREMWLDNRASAEIADRLGRKANSVRQYVAKNRSKLDLPARRRENIHSYKNLSEFDKQWYGKVPLGHWLITKKWSNNNV